MIALRSLQKYAAPPPRMGARASERDEETCDLCSTPVPPGHRHLFDIETRALRCACQACSLLFATPAAGRTLRAVPDRLLVDRAFGLTAGEWAALGVPVGLAFVVHHARSGEHAICFPGPAGVIEAEPPAGFATALAAATPLAALLAADVEALLVYGARGATTLACFLMPIDRAYALGGRLRQTWRGIDGGDDARRELASFLADLDARARRSR
jgi:hypothetical protein